MSSSIDLLRTAIIAPSVVLYDLDEGDIVATGPEVARQLGEPGELYVSPVTEDGKYLNFIWCSYQGEPDEYDIQPTAILRNGGKIIALWALTDLVRLSDKNRQTLLGLNESYEDVIPLPGTGWDLIHLDDALVYDLDDISVRAFADAPPEASLEPDVEEDTPPWDLGMYGDARIITPFDEQDPKYAAEIIISLGQRRDSNDWKPKKVPLGAHIASVCQHREGKKDGPAYVGGDQVPGRRWKTAVKALYVATLDIDSGKPLAEIDRAVKKLGVTAVRYTTHSHGTTETTFPRDTVLKKTGADDLDDEVIRKFLREEKEWDERIVQTASFTGTDHEDKGIVAVVSHAPMDKSRVMIPLGEVFDISAVASTQREAMAKWGKLLRALAKELDVPLDEACLDPSRLFYFPRHDKDRPFDIALFGGPLFDWRSLELDDPFEAELKRLGGGVGGKTGHGPKTEAGKKIGRWASKNAHGFMFADAIREHCPEIIRFEKGPGQLECECPFDDDHSNAGDPEDRGFIGADAGEMGDTFHASCRHDSCQGKNNTDFVAKLIADGKMPESVLTDRDFNLTEEEEEPAPEEPAPKSKPKTDKKSKAKANDDPPWNEDEAERAEEISDPELRELRTNKIFSRVRKFIEPLVKGSGPDAINAAILAVYRDEEIVGSSRQWCFDAIKSRLKANTTTMGKYMKYAREALKTDRKDDDGTPIPTNRAYEFDGEFHFDEASAICQHEMQRADMNKVGKDWGQPVFTCLQERLMKMRQKPDGRITFEELSRDGLWSELNKLVSFVRVNDSVAGKRQKVPEDVGKQCFEQAQTFLPQTPEVTYTPTFTVRGELLTEPGWYYDNKKDLNILLHDCGFRIQSEVPEEPTVAEVDEAIHWLRDELLGEFPFLDTDLNHNERREPSEANALAMLITPFMRRMIDGCTPVFFVTKPVPGTGGTMLGQLPLILYDGENSMPMGYTQSEDEMKKYLVASVTETRSHLFFDDVRDFNNRVLLQAITSRYIGGRLLGSSKNIERPNNFGWIATGNNPIIMQEMDRRICWVRLNAKISDIQKRQFKERYQIEDGKKVKITYAQWINATREKSVYSILVLIQNWIAQGKIPFEHRSLVSFEDWAKKVGGVLQAAGVDGFLDNRNTANRDFNESAVQELIRAWRKQHREPQTGKFLLEWAKDSGLDVIDGNNDDVKRQRFYKSLQSLVGRVFDIGTEEIIVQEGLDQNVTPVFELVLVRKITEAA